MMSYDEIVADVHAQLMRYWTDEELSHFFFSPLSEGSLHEYHHSLGQSIRNTYGLWQISWEPELRDGVDYSPNHPDQRSMSIIQDVWKKGFNRGTI